MIGEGLLNGTDKNNSAEVNISTSESIHLFNPMRQADSKQSKSKRYLPLLELNQLDQTSQIDNNKQQEHQVSSRLFTFMDQKEAERKIIQDYIFKNACWNQIATKQGQEHSEAKGHTGIVSIIEHSKKKRDDFLKKLYKNGSILKENKSISKLNRVSRSKTPKNITVAQHRYETIRPRSRSKTPKLGTFQSNTPITHRQFQLFRAKSNLGKESTNNYKAKDRKQQKQAAAAKRTIELQEDSIKYRQTLNQKELLKKKRQLERQLTLVNQSLLVLKKVDNGKKKSKGGIGTKVTRKKSVGKLGRL